MGGFLRRMHKRTLAERMERIVPAYAWIPLLFLVIINLLAYYGSRLFTMGAVHHSLALPLDDEIPFCPAFIAFYILAYAQWILGFILIAREGRTHCYRVLAGEMIAKLMCMVLFIALPTRTERPPVEGSGIFEVLVRIIYATDAPVNLFPSIHCLDSWICFRGAMGMRKVPRWYAPSMLALTLLVFASTVLVKQHVLVDILAAVLVGEAGLLLSKRFRVGRVFERMEAARGRERGRR